MAIARIDEFLEKLEPLTSAIEIKVICNQELDYLRNELSIETVYSVKGYPNGVKGDARRLKTQISAYRNAIKTLETNYKNSIRKIVNGDKVLEHKALKYFNLAKHEKNDVNQRDRQRVRQDKTNRPSFKAVDAIECAKSLLHSDSYISKVAGLYLLTGRRHEELLITGKFDNPFFDIENESLISDWLEFDIESSLFSGQVKRKNNDDIPYNIPLLAPLETIQDAINWLRINTPHQPGQRPKGSKELGLKVRKEFQDNKLLPIPSGKDTYLNPHNLRSAYAAICWQLYRNSEAIYNCTEDIFVKAIMGHTEETTQSAQSYLDYELNNTEIEKLIAYYG
ncbi:hypothetical protein Sta7437_4982 (plasmid) [Stanieria cyanosphaera PCC 7437]|uniref:Telomere resolvase ResT/TelK catalytic domain-containing protein n=1 Tax=Stanieria cyanosphaera (strain ATCC 29371 / PCC 7437) TaxID=111780 RepID=K9Y2Y9_STAC7|nr:telomere resolvase [Stanieria cyanosphaera]AFZ38402.1 hypothetical protein Sta7437_4982 [Stanieria cyanosphaera PCC 7437]